LAALPASFSAFNTGRRPPGILIRKIGHTYKYYLTAAGQRILLTALKLRELVVILSLAEPIPVTH
jgi:hypothetical protein